MGKYSDDLEKRLRGPGFEAAKNKLLADLSDLASKSGAEKSTEVTKGFDGQGRKNIYQCQTCLGLICTVDRDKGVTPFMIDCKSTPDCKGPMQSSFYMTHPQVKPTFEWYRPTADELVEIGNAITGPYATQRFAATVEHVQKGGLVLRPIKREAAQ
jgi:hypothetical protein